MQTARSVLGGALLSALLGGCGGGGGSGGAAPAAGSAMSAMAQVGAKAFADVSLSASGRQSCASCHDPAAGHAPANDLASQPGGADLSLSGGRQAPSLRYLATNKPFFFAADGTPTGGFFWDGRAQSLARRCSAVAPRTRQIGRAHV